jgi:glucose/arabinose dehydrogenase
VHLSAAAGDRPPWIQARRAIAALLVVISASLLLSGCYRMRSSSGGGQTSFTMPRTVTPGDVALPPGYRIDVVATGLTFPTGVTFDAAGQPFVVESGYSYGEAWAAPRLLAIEPGGQLRVIATGGKNGPWNGVVFHDGAFYVAEGGVLEGGRILRIGADGSVTALVSGLPSFGDHHTNGPAMGPDGHLYLAQGTATNAGVVGVDNAGFGWLLRRSTFHDIPCRDVTLRGENFETPDPLGSRGRATTGAFVPFGTRTEPGQVVRGQVPCSGAIMRLPAVGGPLELVAWGFRNPFGLAFDPGGRLFVTDNAFDVRGSRAVWGAGDLLHAVTPGAWYGWPDFHGHLPVAGRRYKAPGRPEPRVLLADHPNRPPAPAAILGVHSSSNGFDFSRNGAFGHVGQAFIAQLGDLAPTSGKVMRPVGFKVVRVDVGSGIVEDFAVNRGRTQGPASWTDGGGLERPVAARFDPRGEALYVVDFGVMTVGQRGPHPRTGTGVLWRITREAGS